MNKVYTCCPVVRDETLDLFERIAVDGQYRFFPIRKRILWVRESEAKIVLRHDGIDVDDEGCLNDFYGLLTSLIGAIEDEVPRTAERFKVSLGDRLAVELDTTLTDRPVTPDPKPDRMYGCDSRLAAPGWHDPHGPWFLSDAAGESGRPPELGSVVVAERKAIYSTSRHLLGAVPPEVAAWVAEQKAAAGVAEEAKVQP